MTEANGEDRQDVRTGTGILGPLISSYRAAEQSGTGVVTAADVVSECLRRVPATRDVRVSARGFEVPLDTDERDSASLNECDQPDDMAMEAVAALRESAWAVWGERRSSGERPNGVTLVWDAAVLAGVRQALVRAGQAGLTYAGAPHLLVALISNPDSRLKQVLQRSKIEPSEVVGRVESSGILRRNARPWTPTVDMLRMLGLTADAPWLLRVLTAVVRRGLATRVSLGPVIYALADEASRQSVRIGHGRVGLVHLVGAVASFDEQLAASRDGLRPDLVRLNVAGGILRRHVPPHRGFSMYCVDLGRGDAEASSTGPLTRRLGPPWTLPAMRALEGAASTARGLKPREVGSNHLLSAVLETPNDDVRSLLERCGLLLDGVRDEVRSALV